MLQWLQEVFSLYKTCWEVGQKCTHQLVELGAVRQLLRGWQVDWDDLASSRLGKLCDTVCDQNRDQIMLAV